MNKQAAKQETFEMHNEAQAPLPAVKEADEPTTLMAVIARAASDPNCDVNKMRALLDMRRDLERDEAKRVYADAMNRVQEKIRPIAADADNPQTRSRYASYYALDKALRPIYTSNGFALNFDTADGAPENYVRVVCDVSHSGGHERRHHIDMPADGKGAKGGDVMTKTHATGSAVTYGKRYLLGMIFNVAVGEGDDDGNAASTETITEEQALELDALITKSGANRAKFLAWLGVDHILKVPAIHLERAKTELKAKIDSKQKADA